MPPRKLEIRDKPSSSSKPEEIAHDDLCPICHLLLFAPVRTQCNHVLCASCMAQWADASSTTRITPSSLDLDLSDFDPTYDPTSELATAQVPCPMCRTVTNASTHASLAAQFQRKYPNTYKERKEQEEADRGARVGTNGIEHVTILIGNRHALSPSRQAAMEGRERVNRHEWTFFVRLSRPDIVSHINVNLHPTFRPPRVVLREPPFEVRRLGWGFFNIEAEVVLKEPYRWLEEGREDTGAKMLGLDWMLRFEGSGRQGRVRARIRKINTDAAGVERVGGAQEQGRASPVRWPHMDDEEE